jgi:TonB family protein
VTPSPKPAPPEARPKPDELQTGPTVKIETPVNNPVETEASKPEKVETPTVARLDATPKEDRKLPAIHVTEETLRKAALELPEPEYPKAATIGRVQGKVEVQLDIDERGMVINARPISGSPLLLEAAANAGRKARFSPGALSSKPATAFGVITYEFALPPEAKSTAPDTSSASVNQPTTVGERVALEKGPAVTPANQKAIRESASERVLGPPESPPASLASGSSFQKGVASLGSANYSEAVELFKQAIVLDPTDAIAYSKLGIAYSALKEHKEAIRAFKEAIRIKRAFVDAEAYYLMGNSYISLGDNVAAIEPLRQSLYAIRAQQLEPKPDKPSLGTPTELDIRYALGLAYYGSGSFRKATNEFEEAIRINRDSALAHYGLGLAYVEIGDRRAAATEEKILRKLKSPLADKLMSVLREPVTQKRTSRLTF